MSSSEFPPSPNGPGDDLRLPSITKSHFPAMHLNSGDQLEPGALSSDEQQWSRAVMTARRRGSHKAIIRDLYISLVDIAGGVFAVASLDEGYTMPVLSIGGWWNETAAERVWHKCAGHYLDAVVRHAADPEAIGGAAALDRPAWPCGVVVATRNAIPSAWSNTGLLQLARSVVLGRYEKCVEERMRAVLREEMRKRRRCE